MEQDDGERSTNKSISTDVYLGEDSLSGLKQQIDHLIKENIKLKIFADYSSDWEYWIDEYGIIQYVSPSFERISGYSCQNLYQDSNFLLEITFYEDRELLLRSLFNHKKKDEFSLFNFRLINAKNELIWIEHKSSSIDIDGVFRGFRVSNRDITLQINVKKQFGESEKQLHFMKQGLKQFNVLLDLNYIILMFSNSAFEFAQNVFKKQLKIGESFLSNVLENDKVTFIKNFEKAKKGIIVKPNDEFNLSLEQNKYFEFVFIPIINQYNEVESISFIINDLSEIKKSEEELKHNKVYIKKITMSSPNIILVYNVKKQDFIFSNHSIVEKLGYSDNDSYFTHLQKIKSLFCKEDIDLLNSNFDRLLKTEKDTIFQSEYRLKNFYGDVVWFLSYETVLNRGLDGLPSELLFELIDITDYKRLEQSLREINLELVINKNTIESKTYELEKINEKLKDSETKLIELNNNKNRFFSIIAHDLRNPFNALFGSSSFLVQNYQSLEKDEVGNFLNNIYSSAKVIYNLLENLLQWARVQSNKIEYFPNVLSLNEIVEEVILLNKEQLSNKNISIINNVTPELSVFADSAMVSTIFRNLVSNAIKFSYSSGVIEISAVQQNNLVEICVSDTGVGIRKEDLSKLFKIETQFNTSGTGKESGTGLGLILCKEFVEKNKGTIWVKSEFGKGSKIYFTLPAF